MAIELEYAMQKMGILTEEERNRRIIYDATLPVLNKEVMEKVVLPDAVKRAREEHKSLGYLMIDIDHFHNTNTVYGHSRGDQALQHLVAVLQKKIRQQDTLLHARRDKDLLVLINEETVETEIGRMGGEEFGVLLYGATSRHAYEIGERLRTAVEASPARTSDKVIIPVRISIGAASLEPEMTANDLRDYADYALLKAKEQRNRTVLYQNGRFYSEGRVLTEGTSQLTPSPGRMRLSPALIPLPA